MNKTLINIAEPNKPIIQYLGNNRSRTGAYIFDSLRSTFKFYARTCTKISYHNYAYYSYSGLHSHVIKRGSTLYSYTGGKVRFPCYNKQYNLIDICYQKNED